MRGWGKPPPTRVIMGEPAPNAGLQKGDRKGWGNPPPTRVIVKVIEQAIAGYCQGDRTGYRGLFILPLWCLKKELDFSKN